MRKWKSLWERLGPGLITGMADDDPSGIATYSQAGAQFRFSFLWVMVFTVPLMYCVQVACARIGRVTGRGVIHLMRKKGFHKAWISLVVISLAVVNAVNIGADIHAMGACFKLMVPRADEQWATVGMGFISAILMVLVPYRIYVHWLKWLALTLISYVMVTIMARVPWMDVLKAAFIPHLSFDLESVKMLLAILGTTISPYLFFWQASQEVEEIHRLGSGPFIHRHQGGKDEELSKIRFDTWVGMGASNIIAFCIIVAAGVTLNPAGVTTIDSAEQAALALRPLAGDFSFYIFSLGVISAGLLAIPVLAGSAAYAISEAFQFRLGLDKSFSHGKEFYLVIVSVILFGVVFALIAKNPIQALVFAAILNGLLAAPMIFLIQKLSTDRSIMGPWKVSPRLQAGLTITGVLMLVVSIASLFFMI